MRGDDSNSTDTDTNTDTLPPLRDRASPVRSAAMDTKAPETAAPEEKPDSEAIVRNAMMTPRPDQMPTARPTDDARSDAERLGMSGDDAAKVQEEMRRQAEEPNADAMKLWIAVPIDRNAEPFHFSNTPRRIFIWAETEDYARRLAVQAAGGDQAWGDRDKVHVVEFRSKGPTVISSEMGT